MGMPFYFFLIVYVVALLFGVFFFSVSLFHLYRFGFFDFTAKLNTALVVGIFSIVVVFSIIFLWRVDWLETLELSPDLTVDYFSDKI
jgi:hypothetical protein